MKLLPNEKIILKTGGIFGYSISFTLEKKLLMGLASNLGSQGSVIYLTNKRICVYRFTSSILDLPLQNILYISLKNNFFDRTIYVGYKENSEDKEVLITALKLQGTGLDKLYKELSKLINK